MSGVAPQDIFDSEESVLKALSVIRNSTLQPEEKSHLRDLFLDYAGEVEESRRDTLRAEIYNKLQPHAAALPTLSIPKEGASYKEEVAIENKPETTTPASFKIGTRRPTPSFKAPSVVASGPKTVTPSPTPTPEPVEATPKEEVAAVAEPVTPIPTPSEPAPTQSAEAPTPAPVNLRARIDAIKHEINGKVGNPVNLINADEKVGREYMSALLDAMKSASGGGGEATAATRLETAYKEALALIEKMPSNSVSAPEPKEEPEPIEKEPEVEPIAPDVVEEPTPAVEEPVTEVAPVEEVEAVKEPEPTKSYGLYHQPIDVTDEINAEEKLVKEKENAEEKQKETPKDDPSERRVKIGTPKVSFGEVEKTQPLHSLRDEVALPEQMAKVKAEGEKRAEAAKKPITDLKSPEVQTGLEQLLSEWKLFRSSGFLGTGPKGIEHPLYKQLASLPMAAVVAGRFEGVTPEIKQSLTDYMNGWRYEQGVVHEMGETFENYLRRVIKQILTRQRLSISS